MEWTTEKPSRPGWYWYRHPDWEDLKAIVVLVCILPQTNKLTVLWAVRNQDIADTDMRGEWAGPIPEPTERTEGV